METLQAEIQAVAKILAPPPKLTVSQWADARRKLSSEASAEPGQWITARAEYQRGIMDAFSDPLTESVVMMSSAQIGKTEMINNIVGYYIDQDPSPILLTQPTLDMAEAYSKDRLAPMLRDSPALRGKVKDARARDSGNTLLHKTFPGGHITMAGANSPASLASRPIRIVLNDEVDRYGVSAGTEGDPVDLSRKRSTTFWNRKNGQFSTPGVAGASRIEASYEQSDMRRFYVPCWSCGYEQVLKWAQVSWDEAQPETARYKCESCDAYWTDSQRWKAVAVGRWVAEKPFAGTAGFHIWEAYSPWVRLSSTVDLFLKAKNSVERLKGWVNTSLGETWKEKGEAPAWRAIYDRARANHVPLGKVPIGGLFLTAGADVQKDRIEVSFYAWGRGRQSWLVDHVVKGGDPERPETWLEVDELLNASYVHASGRSMSAVRFCIDSGYATNAVYAWARKHGAGRVMVVKGTANGGAPLGQPSATDVTVAGKRLRRGIQVWPVNGNIIKPQFYGWLNLDPIPEGFPDGFCHFPEMNEEFFQQLVAEELHVGKDRHGYRKAEWVKTRPRNEALDCRVYATAGAISVGIERFQDRNWRHFEEMLIPAKDLPAVTVELSPLPAQAPFVNPMPVMAQPPATKPAPRPAYYQPVRSKFVSR